jgi:hypothetical protein
MQHTGGRTSSMPRIRGAPGCLTSLHDYGRMSLLSRGSQVQILPGAFRRRRNGVRAHRSNVSGPGCKVGPAHFRKLDGNQGSWHPTAYDDHPCPGDRLACWGCRAEPMGVAATARDRSLCRVRHRGDWTWSWRYSNPLPRDCVHARDARRPRLAVTKGLPNVVSAPFRESPARVGVSPF